MEALALKAKTAAREALEKELVAQARVRAALERQDRKHRALVKQLEAQGWRLSLTERASRGSLKTGREALEQHLRSEAYSFARAARQEGMRGRGIILAAGGPVPLANAYVALHLLRKVHNCSLPIEIYFNGPYELDVTTKVAFETEFSSLRCINIAHHQLPEHQILNGGHALSRQQSGWVLKAHMLYVTSFEEVLVLDADNVPLADPTFLFESPQYRAAGNLFWPDFWSSNWHNPGPVYDLLNLTEPWEAQPDLLTTESGQFLLNRRQHDTVLEWVMFLNLHADMLYAIIWGDKDTYRLAFTLAGEADKFSQVVQRPANALHAPFTQPEPVHYQKPDQTINEIDMRRKAYTHAGMVQLAPSGEILFLHRTAGSKLDPSFNYPATYRPIDFVTPPLSPRQAAQVHITGPMAVSKFEVRQAAECSAATDFNLANLAAQCGMTDAMPWGGSMERSTALHSFPIPLLKIEVFPGLPELLHTTMNAFRSLQHRYRSKQILLGSPL